MVSHDVIFNKSEFPSLTTHAYTSNHKHDSAPSEVEQLPVMDLLNDERDENDNYHDVNDQDDIVLPELHDEVVHDNIDNGVGDYQLT